MPSNFQLKITVNIYRANITAVDKTKYRIHSIAPINLNELFYGNFLVQSKEFKGIQDEVDRAD